MNARCLSRFLLVLACLAGCSDPAPPRSATLVNVNAAVFTAEVDRPWAEAVAVRDGRILYVGDDAGDLRFITCRRATRGPHRVVSGQGGTDTGDDTCDQCRRGLPLCPQRERLIEHRGSGASMQQFRERGVLGFEIEVERGSRDTGLPSDRLYRKLRDRVSIEQFAERCQDRGTGVITTVGDRCPVPTGGARTVGGQSDRPGSTCRWVDVGLPTSRLSFCWTRHFA